MLVDALREDFVEFESPEETKNISINETLKS